MDPRRPIWKRKADRPSQSVEAAACLPSRQAELWAPHQLRHPLWTGERREPSWSRRRRRERSLRQVWERWSRRSVERSRARKRGGSSLVAVPMAPLWTWAARSRYASASGPQPHVSSSLRRRVPIRSPPVKWQKGSSLLYKILNNNSHRSIR